MTKYIFVLPTIVPKVARTSKGHQGLSPEQYGFIGSGNYLNVFQYITNETEIVRTRSINMD